LKGFEIWPILEKYQNRIRVISGDLSQPFLGIDKQIFEQLAIDIDVIYHSGAEVNSVLPYNVLKPANVNGTIEILKLASIDHIKPIYHISTVSVLSTQSGEKNEDIQLRLTHVDFMGGYGASKLIAEVILQKAANEYKLPLIIYRPGTIAGDTVRGASNTGQFINRYICGIVQMGYAPDVNSFYDMLPADIIAKQIYSLSSYHNFSKVYHLANYDHVIAFNQLTQYINSFGYKLKIIALNDWRNLLLEQSKDLNSTNRLVPLVFMFENRFPGVASSINHSQTVQMLTKLKLDHPIISESIIHAYLSYFIRCGLISPTQ